MLPRGLKVPVHLQALYTHKATPGGPAAPWSDAPFASSTLGAGVTLRWTLPDGLCRAEGDPPIFPSVPDLWLITRLYTTADGRRNRVYDKPATPWQRLQASGILDAQQLSDVATRIEGINPADLTRQINTIQMQLLDLAKTKTEALAAARHIDLEALQPSINRLAKTK